MRSVEAALTRVLAATAAGAALAFSAAWATAPATLATPSGNGATRDALAAYRALAASQARNYDRAQDISPRQLVLLLDVAERTGGSLGQALATGEVESAHTWNDHVRPPLENGTLGSATGVWQFLPGTFHRIIAGFGKQLLEASDQDPETGRERLDLGDGPYSDVKVRGLIRETVEGKRGAEDEELQLLRHNFAVLAFAKHYLSVESGATNPEEDYLFHFLGATQGRRVLALATGEARNSLAVKPAGAPAPTLETKQPAGKGETSPLSPAGVAAASPPAKAGTKPPAKAGSPTATKPVAAPAPANKAAPGTPALAESPRVRVVILPSGGGDAKRPSGSVTLAAAPRGASGRAPDKRQGLTAAQRVSAILNTRDALVPLPSAVYPPPLVPVAGAGALVRAPSSGGVEKKGDTPAAAKAKSPPQARPPAAGSAMAAAPSPLGSQIVPEAPLSVLYDWRTEIGGDLHAGSPSTGSTGAKPLPLTGSPFVFVSKAGGPSGGLAGRFPTAEWGLPADSPVVTGNLGMFYRDGRGQSQPYTWAEFLGNLRRLVRADNQPALVRAKYGVGFGLKGGDSQDRAFKPEKVLEATEFRHENGRSLAVPEALVMGPLDGEETQYYKQRLAALVSQGDDRPLDVLPPETLAALWHLKLLPPTVQEAGTSHPEVQKALHAFRQKAGKAEPDDSAHLNLLLPAERVALEVYDRRLARYAALQACQQATSGGAPDLNRLIKMPAESQKVEAPRIAALQNALAARGLLNKPVEKRVWRDKKGKKQVEYKTLAFAGTADKATVAALNSFQLRNGLRTTQGVVDGVTLELLGLSRGV